MARTLAQLPSKRQFYNTLNAFVEEAYFDLTAGLPKSGQNTYKNRFGGPLKRYDKNKIVPPNSGRLLGSLPKPGRIHVKGLADKTARAGKLVFLVRNEQLYDPVMREQYWSKIAYNAKTDFGNPNPYKFFWKGASKQLIGKLKTYRDQYATYKPSWHGRFSYDELEAMEMELDILFMSTLQQADEEGLL